jgi:hypothetical protein
MPTTPILGSPRHTSLSNRYPDEVPISCRLAGTSVLHGAEMCPFAGLFLRAGDGGRTRDLWLGKQETQPARRTPETHRKDNVETPTVRIFMPCASMTFQNGAPSGEVVHPPAAGLTLAPTGLDSGDPRWRR